MRENEENELLHLVDAFYSNGPGGYQPVMTCSCGWSGHGETWADVGEFYDEHLKEGESTNNSNDN